jgi:hypothetical protein
VIEYHQTCIDGRFVVLQRCQFCAKELARATGAPITDNGFVPTNTPIQHLRHCPERGRKIDER